LTQITARASLLLKVQERLPAVRRQRLNRSYSVEIDLSTKATYAVCRNLYSHSVSGLEHPGIHTCVCETQGRGATCDQMNRAALAVIQTIVEEMKGK
jgi:hypothetical protein